MVKITIDGKEIEARDGDTVLNAALAAGIEIPHFCYHPAFAPEGSCRLCLVEVQGSPKLELACATPVKPGLVIATSTQPVFEARRSVLEFFLADHPLDCPICDKAGECDLQNYYQAYGLYDVSFHEPKEKHEKKVRIGEKLLLDRERCVLCTRCVRFLRETTKTHELGIVQRGVRSEISTYDGEGVRNDYSGNLVDLCPVGAITDLDFRFKTRTWFFARGESICPLCSRGCNIYVDFHPGFARIPGSAKVYRIRPRTNETVNRHWICDFGRYGYAGLLKSRCQNILERRGGQEARATWDSVYQSLAPKIQKLHSTKKPDQIAVILTSWLSNEELFLAKKLFKDDLSVRKIYFADPAPGQGDGFLLEADRSPNQRGARELGFDPKPVGLEEFCQNTELLFIFGPHLAETHSLADLKPALDKIETKILVTSRLNGLESLVDYVLPASSLHEKSGSFTNSAGIVQKFAAVCHPRTEVRPEWSILVGLAAAVQIRPLYYAPLVTSEAVLQAAAAETPFFGLR
jgi:NADH-quinone oxidoreductase subunit G